MNSGTLLFKLSEIHSLYVKRLEELSIKKLVNKTRLKDHLLERFPVAQEQYDGRNTVLVFKEGCSEDSRLLRRCSYPGQSCYVSQKRHLKPSRLQIHWLLPGSMPRRLNTLKPQVSCFHDLEWLQLERSRQA